MTSRGATTPTTAPTATTAMATPASRRIAFAAIVLAIAE